MQSLAERGKAPTERGKADKAKLSFGLALLIVTCRLSSEDDPVGSSKIRP